MGKEKDIMQFLLPNSKDGKIVHGKIGEAATMFHCSNKSIQRLWKSATTQMGRGEVIQVSNKRQGRFRARKHEVNYEDIQQIHYQKRATIRALADQLKITKYVVGRWCKDKLIRAHTNAIKPDLTAPNKLSRLSFSLQAIQYERETNCLKFKPMENTIHIDEKWFYLTKKTQRYYMTPLETDPHRRCKSSKYIPKVMFMCAVCRPIFAENGTCIFDGKIGMWPFTEEVAAKRNIKKRQRGTIETKPIESITKEVIKSCIINQTNDYKIPHMNKNGLLLQNALPTNLEVEEELVKECIDYLITEGFATDIKELIEELGLEIPI